MDAVKVLQAVAASFFFFKKAKRKTGERQKKMNYVFRNLVLLLRED